MTHKIFAITTVVAGIIMFGFVVSLQVFPPRANTSVAHLNEPVIPVDPSVNVESMEELAVAKEVQISGMFISVKPSQPKVTGPGAARFRPQVKQSEVPDNKENFAPRWASSAALSYGDLREHPAGSAFQHQVKDTVGDSLKNPQPVPETLEYTESQRENR